MQHLVLNHVGLLGKCLITSGTFIRFDSWKAPDEKKNLLEPKLSRETNRRKITTVQHLVLDHVGLLRKSLSADGTFVGFNS